MPTPLDEVRSELAIFDETLFSAVPGFQRAIDRALDAAVDSAGAGAVRSTAPIARSDAGAGRTGPARSSRPRCSGSGRGSGRTGTATRA